jgi:hypothetical protein
MKQVRVYTMIMSVVDATSFEEAEKKMLEAVRCNMTKEIAKIIFNLLKEIKYLRDLTASEDRLFNTCKEIIK